MDDNNEVIDVFAERRGIALAKAAEAALMICRPRSLGAARGTIGRAAEVLPTGSRLAVHITVSVGAEQSTTTAKVGKELTGAGFVDLQEIVVVHEGWARGRMGALRQPIAVGHIGVTSRLLVGAFRRSTPPDPELGFNPSPDCSPTEWATLEKDQWTLPPDGADWFGEYEIARRLAIRTTQPGQTIADVDCEGGHVETAAISLQRKYVRVPRRDDVNLAGESPYQESLFDEIWSGEAG